MAKATFWRFEGCILELVSCLAKATFWRLEGCMKQASFWNYVVSCRQLQEDEARGEAAKEKGEEEGIDRGRKQEARAKSKRRR